MFTFKEVTYDINEVRRYEDYVIKFLSHKLNYYTTFSILEYLLSNGIAFYNEFSHHDSKTAIKEKIKKLNKLSFQILNSIVEDINYVNFNHIEIAFSCVVYAREVMKFKTIFHPEFEKIYDLKMGNILKCYHFIAG